MFGKKKPNHEDKVPAAGPKIGDKIIAIDDNHVFKVMHEFSEEQKKWLDESTIVFVQGRGNFMHYGQDGLAEKRGDPEWENQAVFFWDAKETFPRKSLPPNFDLFPKHYFSFTRTDLGEISLHSGQAAPWFGEPGGGTKYYCEKNGEMLPIGELHRAGLIEYMEIVDFSLITQQMLLDRDHYYFLAADALEFIEGWPAVGGKVVPISIICTVGLCSLIRRA